MFIITFGKGIRELEKQTINAYLKKRTSFKSKIYHKMLGIQLCQAKEDIKCGFQDICRMV